MPLSDVLLVLIEAHSAGRCRITAAPLASRSTSPGLVVYIERQGPDEGARRGQTRERTRRRSGGRRGRQDNIDGNRSGPGCGVTTTVPLPFKSRGSDNVGFGCYCPHRGRDPDGVEAAGVKSQRRGAMTWCREPPGVPGEIACRRGRGDRQSQRIEEAGARQGWRRRRQSRGCWLGRCR